MIVLYLFTLLALAVLHVLLRFRVTRLEKRYARIATEADAFLKASATRGGTNRPDPYQVVKQQYELALLALRRDRAETRYVRGQGLSERVNHLRRRLIGYRGRLVPYLFGLMDVTALVLVLNRFEIGLAEVQSMLGL